MTMAIITELSLFQSLNIKPNISYPKLFNRKESITEIIASVCGKGLKAALFYILSSVRHYEHIQKP